MADGILQNIEEVDIDNISLEELFTLIENDSNKLISTSLEKISIPLYGKVKSYFDKEVDVMSGFTNKKLKKIKDKKVAKALDNVEFSSFSTKIISVPVNFSGSLTIYSKFLPDLLIQRKEQTLKDLDTYIEMISYLITNKDVSKLKVFLGIVKKKEAARIKDVKGLHTFFPKNTGITLTTVRSVFKNKNDILEFVDNINHNMDLTSTNYLDDVINKVNKLSNIIDLLKSMIESEPGKLSKKELKELAYILRVQAEDVEFLSTLTYNNLELINSGKKIIEKILSKTE